MKTSIAAILPLLAALTAHADSVAIQLADLIVVEQPVTVVQSISVSSVPVRKVTFDMETEKIVFLCSFGTSGNATVELSGSEFQAIKTQFLTPFAAQVAPLIQAKLSAKP